MNSTKPSYQQSIQFSTDLSSVADVLDWFKQFDQPPVPHTVWLECQIALAEGFTNAVRHAHVSKAPETPIEIEILITDCELELKIWDCGSGFNIAESLNDPQMDQTAEHGRGIKIIGKIADRVSYTRIDQRNCLVITKQYTTATSQAD
jgi:serine/threonine-protein kinase RsbW